MQLSFAYAVNFRSAELIIHTHLLGEKMRRDAKLNDSKEIIIVPGVTHVDLYDQMDKIPFDGIRKFFEPALC